VFYVFDPMSGTLTSATVHGGTPGRIACFAMDYSEAINAYVFITPQRETWAYRSK
jgi:hypothetical protein